MSFRNLIISGLLQQSSSSISIDTTDYKSERVSIVNEIYANGLNLIGDGTINNNVEHSEKSSLDRQDTSIIVTVNDVNSRFFAYKRGSYLRGTMIEFDLDNSLLRFKKPWGGGSVPGDEYTAPIDIPITVGSTYKCVLRRDRGISYASIENVSTNEKSEIQNEFGVGIYYFCGSFWGYPGFACSQGDITVNEFHYDGLFPVSPKIGFYGDSWTEAYTLQNTVDGLNNVWNRKLWDDYNGNVLISGRGGDQSPQLLDRLTMDFDPFVPEICFILIGLNDGNYSTWSSNVQSIKQRMESAGSKVVLTTLPPRAGKVWINDANAEILIQTNNDVLDIAKAFTLNGDRVTQNPIYYDAEGNFNRDGVHYNHTGSELLYTLITNYMLTQ